MECLERPVAQEGGRDMADGLRGGGGYAKIDLLYRKRTREGGWVEEGGCRVKAGNYTALYLIFINMLQHMSLAARDNTCGDV